jgi:hypothetical protein
MGRAGPCSAASDPDEALRTGRGLRAALEIGPTRRVPTRGERERAGRRMPSPNGWPSEASDTDEHGRTVFPPGNDDRRDGAPCNHRRARGGGREPEEGGRAARHRRAYTLPEDLQVRPGGLTFSDAKPWEDHREAPARARALARSAWMRGRMAVHSLLTLEAVVEHHVRLEVDRAVEDVDRHLRLRAAHTSDAPPRCHRIDRPGPHPQPLRLELHLLGTNRTSGWSEKNETRKIDASSGARLDPWEAERRQAPVRVGRGNATSTDSASGVTMSCRSPLTERERDLTLRERSVSGRRQGSSTTRWGSLRGEAAPGDDGLRSRSRPTRTPAAKCHSLARPGPVGALLLMRASSAPRSSSRPSPVLDENETS